MSTNGNLKLPNAGEIAFNEVQSGHQQPDARQVVESSVFDVVAKTRRQMPERLAEYSPVAFVEKKD